MAPVELKDVSSNWKKLQKTLQSSNPISSKLQPLKAEGQERNSPLKRKRAGKFNGGHKPPLPLASLNGLGKPLPHKHLPSRKRQKMEEPHSIGSATKHAGPKALRPSISMPSLRQPTPLPTPLTDPKSATTSISILAPSPHNPDIENEGVSHTALPGKYIALDCEMVGTGPEPDRDSALARVSVVNYHGHQVYDSYVQVKVPVTDYRTFVSGIEPKHLRHNVARPFKEVQDDIKILLQGRILVGHAVKNDLAALILSHPKPHIRDTSKFSKFREVAAIPGRTPGLKYLVEKLLGVEIQVGHHSSVEDARATMALYRLEKDEFEDEIRKRYGHIKLGDPEKEIEVMDRQPIKRKNKNKKKKKKKKS
ncbi:RNA exonuclease 4 [Lindgomyces ingoldianus]|uniref:RNA exonuclease 4 n=1 Tax=Lindgomyces ingoldianus TaxID=673940 RepID=A0ACB6QMB2_9PLEO|nr:RNA exonuclease 4 [Lindgomyces ingoldianus]KAF2467665.1 RNA exonuclease 4 [Lindgomyces ingoldianus]